MDDDFYAHPDDLQNSKPKKRRRRAIDPSIGYYVYSNCDNGPIDSAKAEAVRLNSQRKGAPEVCKDEAPSPDLPGSTTTSVVPPETTITVERFLRIQAPGRSTAGHSFIKPRSSVALPHSTRNLVSSTVNYLKLRSRAIRRTDSLTRSSDAESSASSASHNEVSVKTRRRRKGKGRFEKRIYEAAVVTGVDLDNDFVRPKDTPASKPPLSFQPISPPTGYRRGRGDIVAPDRKNNPFRVSRFFRPVDASKRQLPLTRWRTYLAGSPAPVQQGTRRAATHAITRPRAGKNTENVSATPSLVFVPLAQAEDEYKAIFPSLHL